MKKPTLVEILTATARAMMAGLRKTCGISARFGDALPANAEVPTDGMLTASIPQGPGPLAEIVLSCHEDLARRVTIGFLEKDESSRHSMIEPTAAGFRILSTVVAEHLERANPWYAGLGEVKRSDPESIDERTRHATGFLLSLATDCGALHMRVLLPIIDHATVHDPEEEHATLEGDEASALITDLIEADTDIQIELHLDRFTTKLHPGRLVKRAKHRQEPVLLMASPAIARPEGAAVIGHDVPVYVITSGRLLGFRSSARAVVRYPILDQLMLPVLAVDMPTRIGPGQRRRAFRVLPCSRVVGEIEPWETAVSGGGSRWRLPVMVRDLSFTGVGLFTRNVRAASYAQGDVVIVRIGLPEPYGQVELPGIVRHNGRARGDWESMNIGIELLQDGEWRAFESAHDRVRAYVMELQRNRLGEEAA